MSYTAKTITVQNGFGYELYDSTGTLYIHQPFDPTQTGTTPYTTADAANSAANGAITALTPPATSTTSTSGATTSATS